MDNDSSTKSSLLEFAGMIIPVGCRRIFITAELESSNGDPRIQPTGFPDIGPVLYPDPSGKQGLICLIESEASMANRLEEVCLADKYTGELKPALKGLPYIMLTETGLSDGRLITTSTIDGHRFASEYVMSSLGCINASETPSIMSFDPKHPDAGAAPKEEKASSKRNNKPGGEANEIKPEFVAFVRGYLGMTGPNRCPAANVPDIFVLAMEYDPLSLIHGFQISVKKKLTFVGLRSPRALTASIVGFNCQRLIVPGVRFDPIGTGDAGQAIFQKQRITADHIEARFSIDVGLLASLRLDALKEKKTGLYQDARLQLLLAIALWKVASFLNYLKFELSLRTECKLRLKAEPKVTVEPGDQPKAGQSKPTFPYESIGTASLIDWIAKAGLKNNHSPLVLKFKPPKDREGGATAQEEGTQPEPEPVEE